ncbi:MAG: hypothetical protein ABSH34_08680 [Verrucomicrobiota bacterium]
MVDESVEGGVSRRDFINEVELLERIPVSRRTIHTWGNEGKIPCVRMCGKRVLFHWPSVQEALLRNQRSVY